MFDFLPLCHPSYRYSNKQNFLIHYHQRTLVTSLVRYPSRADVHGPDFPWLSMDLALPGDQSNEITEFAHL